MFEVVASSGDSFLGGADFDGRIIDYLAESFLAQHGINLRQDKVALQRLREAAETAKCELSFKNTVEVTLPFIATKRSPCATSRLSKATPETANGADAAPPVASAMSAEVQRSLTPRTPAQR